METNHLRVFVYSQRTDIKSKEVLIFPDPDATRWNDFGNKIRCILVADLGNEGSIEQPIYFAFTPIEGSKPRAENLQYLLEDYLEKENFKDQKIELTNNDRFFSMLPDMASYRRLVSKLGVDNSIRLLEVINDLVVRKDDKSFSNEFNIIRDYSEPFNLGFMRNSESYFALHNARSILNGLEQENIGVLSNKLALKFKLDNFQNEHLIRLNYEAGSILPKRINVLIGENGLGKSSALKIFTQAALQHKTYKDCLFQEGTTKEGFGKRAMINRLIALATPGETVKTFPPERRRTQKLYYRKLALSGTLKAEIGTEILNLIRVDDSIASNSRWTLFLLTVSKFIDIDSVYLKMKPNFEKKYVKLRGFEEGKGSEQRRLERWNALDVNADPMININEDFFPLSSGQLTFFKIALLLCRYIDNGTYILIDEPETHLHPRLISQFVDLLDYLLEETGSFALMATHSPYFVREVASKQVHVFKSFDGTIRINNPTLKTFGANIDSISTFVFDEEKENQLVEKLSEKARGMSFEKIDKDLGDDLSISALMAIEEKLSAGNDQELD